MFERKLEIRYRKRGSAHTSDYVVTPLALVQRGVIFYLSVVFQSHTDVRLLAVHRIEEATLLDEAGEVVENFEIDQEVAKGIWGFGAGNTIELKLRFYDGKGQHLLESPLSLDQVDEPDPVQPDVLTIMATVSNTPQLKWWIQGFGDGVEVLAPEELRRDLSQAAKIMAERYSASLD